MLSRLVCNGEISAKSTAKACEIARRACFRGDLSLLDDFANQAAKAWHPCVLRFLSLFRISDFDFRASSSMHAGFYFRIRPGSDTLIKSSGAVFIRSLLMNR